MKLLIVFLALILASSAIVSNVSAWKFAAVGDIECKDAKNVANSINTYSNPLVVLLLGDLGYKKSSQCIEDAFGSKGLATIGNHDKSKDVLKVFGLKKAIYSKDINNVTFLSLNSDTKASKNTKTVTNLVKGVNSDFIVAFSHYPCVTNPSAHHKEWKDCKKKLVPIFVNSGIKTLYINGHNHSYQQCSYKDIEFITAGTGGRDPYPWGNKFDDNCRNNISGLDGYLEVDVQNDSMTGQFIDFNGKVDERTTFQVLK